MLQNKGLGQHFLACKKCLGSFESEIRNSGQRFVVEIGGGDGALSEIIAKNAKSFFILEIDGHWCGELAAKFPGKVLRADCARIPLKRLPKGSLIVSNLPYKTAVEILLEAFVQTESDLLVGVQDEFAEKIIAKPGSEMYSAISVVAQNFFECKKLFRMEGKCFRPAARVSSAAVSVIRRERKTPRELASIYNTLAKLLSQRNKNLSWLTKKYDIQTPRALAGRKIGSLSPDELLNAAAMVLSAIKS